MHMRSPILLASSKTIGQRSIISRVGRHQYCWPPDSRVPDFQILLHLVNYYEWLTIPQMGGGDVTSQTVQHKYGGQAKKIAKQSRRSIVDNNEAVACMQELTQATIQARSSPSACPIAPKITHLQDQESSSESGSPSCQDRS